MTIASAVRRFLRMMRRSSAISTSIRTSNNDMRRFHSIEWGGAGVQGGGIRFDRRTHGIQTPRSFWSESQSALSGYDEFRPADERAGQLRSNGSGIGARYQFF